MTVTFNTRIAQLLTRFHRIKVDYVSQLQMSEQMNNLIQNRCGELAAGKSRVIMFSIGNHLFSHLQLYVLPRDNGKLVHEYYANRIVFSGLSN